MITIASNSKMETSEYLRDSRGVRRGRCTTPGCLCDGYNGGNEMKKCHLCAHPPGKHANMDSPATTSHRGSTGTYSHPMGAGTNTRESVKLQRYMYLPDIVHVRLCSYLINR